MSTDREIFGQVGVGKCEVCGKDCLLHAIDIDGVEKLICHRCADLVDPEQE